eukprot:TRINITY_DN1353_c0_g1_i1.p2 TRINITY_DN1353_c0_g1~~TRINITY_DN1353_c0_g1_i1.p2  ORF type:complete len:450 (+),score=151.11 TRINITY_DN1353_c0_g1_i1:942-2291(+)
MSTKDKDHSKDHHKLLTPLPSRGSEKNLVELEQKLKTTSLDESTPSEETGNIFPSVSASAPGKVILFGEHAVVYGKKSLAASAGLRTTVNVSGDVEDDKVVVQIVNLDRTFAWPVSELAKIAENFVLPHPSSVTAATQEQIEAIEQFVKDDIHHGVTALLFMYLTITSSVDNIGAPYKFVINSELPIGAGMGSSASFMVSVVAALLATNGVYKCGGCKGCIKGDDICEKQLGLINDWAYEGEVIIHGRPSGIDNSVACYGGALTFQSGEITPLEGMPSLRFLIINTNVSRNTKHLVAGVRDKHNTIGSVIEPLLDAMENITKECIGVFDAFKSEQQENAMMTREQMEQQLGTLMDINQHLLNAIGVGHPTLDTIHRISTEHGMSCKLTGAGGGGCALSMIPAGMEHPEVEAVMKELEEQGFEVFETQLGGQGVTLFRTDLETVSVNEDD